MSNFIVFVCADGADRGININHVPFNVEAQDADQAKSKVEKSVKSFGMTSLVVRVEKLN